MKVKYKITDAFGLRDEGEIIDTFILSKDDDSGIALCYHQENPENQECGSFEFIKKHPKYNYWIQAFNKNCYVNQGSHFNTNKDFRKFLKTIK